MRRSTGTTLQAALICALTGGIAAGCDNPADPTTPILASSGPVLHGGEPPAVLADDVRTVGFGERSLELWPFTGWDLSGERLDPVNILFVGESGPANIRAALMGLDGDRSAFGLPQVAPFDCVWADAAGGMQASWGAGEWTGSVIQLECGAYQTIRFHLRLFPAGDWTAANAHFEVLIPGTPNHQVLSWDLAKQIVQMDLARTGLLDTGAPFGVVPGLTPSPTFRTIPAVIYNGLPEALRALIGGPPVPVSDPVGIPNDGVAIIANVAGRAVPSPGSIRNDFEVPFAQVIPKPFCASSPGDFVLVQGPVRFSHRVATTTAGEVSAEIQVLGDLTVTPFDVQTGAPAGEMRSARLNDHYSASTLGRSGRVASTQLRLITASGERGPAQSERTRLRIGPFGLADHSRQERCGF